MIQVNKYCGKFNCGPCNGNYYPYADMEFEEDMTESEKIIGSCIVDED